MNKLYSHYGCVCSAKSLNLLSVVETYEKQGKRVLIIKPALDTRDGYDIIKSRAGGERKVDYVIHTLDDLKVVAECVTNDKYNVLISDEGQFYSAEMVDLLKKMTIHLPVMVWTLLTDFKTKMFEGAQRLVELSDKLVEVKTTCFYCDRKAQFNQRHIDGKPVYEGTQIEVGGLEKYYPTCYTHYYKPPLKN